MARQTNKFALLFVCVAAASCAKNLNMETKRFDLAEVELKSIMGTILDEDFEFFDLGEILRKKLYCTACLKIVGILNIKRAFLKLDSATIDPLLSRACDALGLVKAVDAEECKGLVKMYLDTILYIANHNGDARSLCGTAFHAYSCATGMMPPYTIRINTNHPRPKQASSFDRLRDKALKILQVTDVHFDPLYQAGSNAKCSKDMCCMATSGKPEQITDRAGYWTDYRNCDIPDYFISSAFKQMINNNEFDYVYFTGDIISHRVWATTEEGNIKVMRYFWTLFKQYFHGHSVFPLLGNHEPHPTNQYPPPYLNNTFSVQWLFNHTTELWKDFLPSSALETVRLGGYYSVSPRKGLRVIALNSNVAYYYNFWIAFDDKDPFGQLQWLADELQKAEDNGEVVHLLSHVTAGLEMVDSWAEKLLLLVRRYANTIGAIFNGHTHADEFMVYEALDSTPLTIAYNGGSLTPFNGVNPNYKVYDVDPTSFDVLDYSTFAINLTEANLHPGREPVWFHLYSFKEEYGLRDASPREVRNLVTRLTRDPYLRRRYYNNYVRFGTPSMEKGCNKDCQAQLLCDIVNTVNSNRKPCRELKKQIKYE